MPVTRRDTRLADTARRPAEPWTLAPDPDLEVVPMSRTVPPSDCAGLPELGSGCHLVPEDGACLMEYVSVLAGTPFSDHPSCTDPTLASLARLVNDASTDAGRPLLATFAPQLAGTGPLEPSGTAAVVLATVCWAQAAAGEPPAMRRRVRRAQQRYDRVTGTGARASLARRLDAVHRAGPARHRLEASVAALHALPEERRDPALRAALAAAITAAVASTGGSPRGTAGTGDAVPSTTAGGARDVLPV
jgi:hypothetical protein